MTVDQSPFDLLLSYQQRALDIHGDIQAIPDVREQWTGLAFQLGEQILVIEMSEVDEIVDTPNCARVPNTKLWFLGIGNIRGKLIPITDLHEFVYQTGTLNRTGTRVLTCSDGESTTGILVDNILGLRRFYADERFANTAELPPGLNPFVRHSYQRYDSVYPVFQIKEFVKSSEFLQAGK
jgi:twitching motility protein PilI